MLANKSSTSEINRIVSAFVSATRLYFSHGKIAVSLEFFMCRTFDLINFSLLLWRRVFLSHASTLYNEQLKQ